MTILRSAEQVLIDELGFTVAGPRDAGKEAAKKAAAKRGKVKAAEVAVEVDAAGVATAAEAEPEAEPEAEAEAEEAAAEAEAAAKRGAKLGLDMDGESMSGDRIHAEILHHRCVALSNMKKHEAAIHACDASLDASELPLDGALSMPFRLARTYEARATAHEADNNFGEATDDLLQAKLLIEKTGAQKVDVNRLMHKWRQAQHKAKQWDENRGVEGHIKVLALPVNVEELNTKSRCAWLKKAHRKMSLKWHPDKAKGGKKRAARKFTEVTAAKKALGSAWGCKRRGAGGGQPGTPAEQQQQRQQQQRRQQHQQHQQHRRRQQQQQQRKRQRRG